MARDPIHKETLQDGRTRYWFRVGMKDPKTGKYIRPRRTFDTLKEARTERGKLVADRGRGLSVVPSKVTVAEWAERWLEAKASEVKRSTLRHYSDSLKPVVDQWGDVPLQKLDTSNLEALKTEMLSGEARRVGRKGEPLAPRTVNAMITAVAMMLEDALQQQVVHRNVAAAVKRVRKGRTNTRARRGAWQPDHSIAFLRSVADHRLVGAWWLSMLGLRRGEVLGLRWSVIDLDAGTLMIDNNRVDVAGEVMEDTPKSEASERPLPIPAPALAALRSMKAQQAAEKLAAGRAYTDTASAASATGTAAVDGATEDASNVQLVELRKAAGLTRAEVADLARASLRAQIGRRGKVNKVNADYVYRLERGLITWPSDPTRAAFREVFGVDDDARLGFRNPWLTSSHATTLRLYAEAVDRGEQNKAGYIAAKLGELGETITEDGVHSRLMRARKKGELPAAPYVGDTGLLVVDEIGRPYRPQFYSAMFEKLAADARLPRIPLHGCRHAAASLLADLGVPIVVAAAWLGQSQESITEQYQHAFDAAMKDAGDRLGRRLAGLG